MRVPSEKGYDNTDAHVGEHAHYETAGIAPIKNELRSKMQYATDGWLTTMQYATDGWLTTMMLLELDPM